MAEEINFDDRFRGDTQPFEFTITAGAAISGWTLYMTLDSRRAPDDETTQHWELTGVVTQAGDASTPGKVEFRPSAAQMDLLGEHYYNLQANDGSYTETIAYGRVRFKQDITKTT